MFSDRELVCFVALHGAVAIGHIIEAFGVGRTAAYRRAAACILDQQLVRTGRTGTDRVFGRAADGVFYPSTIDGRARRAWKAYNLAEREAAHGGGARSGPLETPDPP
ncbi:MAG TPA: hypothetical protein VHP56_08980 [Solirubrobacterales bacterium]|nr:hypothetical protein [Solirubrobacterales bacterium]